MSKEMFKPIGGGRRAAKTAAGPTGGETWLPVLPVPDQAPAPPNRHYQQGTPSATWRYLDATGHLIGLVMRFDLAGGGKEFRALGFWRNAATDEKAWRWKGFAEPRPLYGIDRLAARPKAPVVIVEGEKAADAAAKLLPDHVAVTSPNGAKSAGKADWSVLAGRQVAIWPDADPAGQDYAATVAKLLGASGGTVAVVEPPPGVKAGWDAADALAEGWNPERAIELVRDTRAFADDAAAATTASPAESAAERPRKRQAAELLELIDGLELWHTPDREAFASIVVDGHVENWAVRSRTFRLWLGGLYYERTGGAPSSQTTEDAIRAIEARAIFKGPEFPTFLRVGEIDGDVLIDLADAHWRAVRITPNGWKVIDRAPIKFVRANAMRPLPEPVAGEMIEALHEFVNVRTEGDLKLFIAWLVGALRPRGPYPILAVNGEQGSAKSTLTRLARELIDPSTAPIRSAPKDEQGLVIGARNSWIAALDNLSDIPSWLSDSLCRLSTGGGFSARELFTDFGEVVVNVTRPVILNGIPDLTSRPDLADRCIHLTLPAIGDDARQSEADFWGKFEACRPGILGALYDAVSGALRRRDQVKPAKLTRMADFQSWVSAAEQALGWNDGDFLEAYTVNRRGAVEATIERDPIATAVCGLVEFDDWEGTATELLAELEKRVGDQIKKSRSWPAVNGLKARLRRLQAPLRAAGVVLDLEHRSSDAKRKRLMQIHRPERS